MSTPSRHAGLRPPQRNAETASPKTPATPNTVSPQTHILQLQRLIGNRAVQHLVQREGEGEGGAATVIEGEEIDIMGDAAEAARPLSAAQERTAIAFYASDRRYSADIINQIQEAIGQPQTGTMTADDVQAVGRWQSDHFSGDLGLRADGMTGPRTLSAMFPFGLLTEENMTAFTGEIDAVFDTWDTLATAQARGTAIVNAVNQRLTANGVPATTPVVQALGASTLGEFTDTTWTIAINQNIVSAATLTDAVKQQMVNTVYHEARHAEQVFREARSQAGQRKTAAQIARTMGIPANIAQAAFADPLAPGDIEALVAQDEFQAFYGTGAANTRAVYAELEASGTAFRTAQTNFDNDPSAANRRALERARARRQLAFDNYQNLPEEHDAFWTGNAMEFQYALAHSGDEATEGSAP